MLAYLVEDLIHKGKLMEAKGIVLRNGIETYIRRGTVQAKLREITYDENQDSSLTMKDSFAPMSQPNSDYI